MENTNASGDLTVFNLCEPPPPPPQASPSPAPTITRSHQPTSGSSSVHGGHTQPSSCAPVYPASYNTPKFNTDNHSPFSFRATPSIVSIGSPTNTNVPPPRPNMPYPGYYMQPPPPHMPPPQLNMPPHPRLIPPPQLNMPPHTYHTPPFPHRTPHPRHPLHHSPNMPYLRHTMPPPRYTMPPPPHHMSSHLPHVQSNVVGVENSQQSSPFSAVPPNTKQPPSYVPGKMTVRPGTACTVVCLGGVGDGSLSRPPASLRQPQTLHGSQSSKLNNNVKHNNASTQQQSHNREHYTAGAPPPLSQLQSTPQLGSSNSLHAPPFCHRQHEQQQVQRESDQRSNSCCNLLDPHGKHATRRDKPVGASSKSSAFVPPSFHPLHPEVLSAKKDQKWVDEWLKRKQTLKPSGHCSTSDENQHHQPVDGTSPWRPHAEEQLTLRVVHAAVARYKSLLAQLRNFQLQRSLGMDQQANQQGIVTDDTADNTGNGADNLGNGADNLGNGAANSGNAAANSGNGAANCRNGAAIGVNSSVNSTIDVANFDNSSTYSSIDAATGVDGAKSSPLLSSACCFPDHSTISADALSCSLIKDQLQDLSEQFIDPSYRARVIRLVGARRRKRERSRRSKKARRDWRRKREQEIDTLRKQVIRQEKEQQRVDRVRAEADTVLREVRSKQQEGEGLLSLVSRLRDLRQHRLNRGEQQGYVSTSQHDTHFGRIMDGLEEMVECQLKEYELEERTLRAMMDLHHTRADKESNTVTSVSKVDKKQQLEEDGGWAVSPSVEALFGSGAPLDQALYASYTAADNSLEMLLNRRRGWDEHLSTVSDGGSGVPLSWVTPPRAANTAWQRWMVD